jgi:hypothetical protein
MRILDPKTNLIYYKENAMFLPMFLHIDGTEKRLPLQKIMTYEPDYSTRIPTLKILMDFPDPDWIEIRYDTVEELRTVVGNLDALASAIPISKDRLFQVENPSGGGGEGQEGMLH